MMIESDELTFDILSSLMSQLNEGNKITKNSIYDLASKYNVLQKLDNDEYNKRNMLNVDLPYHFMKLIIGWSPANKPDKNRILHAKRNGIRLLGNTQPSIQVNKAVDESYMTVTEAREDGIDVRYYTLTKKGIKELEKHFKITVEFEGKGKRK